MGVLLRWLGYATPLLLAWLRLRTGSLYPAVEVHCTWNLVAYLGAAYAVQ